MAASADMQSSRLERVLEDAEAAARAATEALLDDLPGLDERMEYLVEVLREYCRQAADPLEALAIARLNRAMIMDLEMPPPLLRDVREWARRAVRLQYQASHTVRLLRDQGLLTVEQVIIELSIVHLRFLEESPLYAAVLSEMAELMGSPSPVRPVSLLNDIYRRGWAAFALPTTPPAHGA